MGRRAGAGVVGSVNLDLVASGAPLPQAGETVTGAQFAQHPGGKGANQAVAAAESDGPPRSASVTFRNSAESTIDIMAIRA